MNVPSAPQYEPSGGDASALLEGYARTPLRFEAAWTDALMRTVRVGSAGVVVLVAGYSPYLPSVGTSPAVVDCRPLRGVDPKRAARAALRASSALRSVMALSVADQARELLAALSLNKSQLAEVLRVSRPTVYDWLEGKEPNASNAERLTTLLRVLKDVGITSASPLHPRFVRQPLAEESPALIDILRGDALDESAIKSLARDAKELVHRAENRRVAREDRLRALGFEDPSDEQRREQLARNVAMRDWPKT